MGSGHASYYLVDGDLAVIGEGGSWAQLFEKSHSENNYRLWFASGWIYTRTSFASKKTKSSVLAWLDSRSG